jgi:glycosyltransferase involved in cell wall biosynthesis
VKYVFVIHGLPIGGAEKFLISLLDYFNVKENKCYLILLSNDVTLKGEIPIDLPVIIINKKYKIDIVALFTLRKQLKKLDSDLVVCINPYAYFIVKAATIFSTSFKICLSPHSTIPFNFKNRIQTYLYYLFFNPNDLIIFLCEAQQKYDSSHFAIRLRHSYIINNGIDLTYFNKKMLFSSSILNNIRGNNSKLIVYVARLSPEKRHQDAIEVIKNLNMTHDYNIHLLIVGDGPTNYSNNMVNLVHDKKLSHVVHFLGSQSDVRPFYNSADLFLMTSSSETFSIAAIEAMSFGLPCVLTDVGGASEIVLPDFNGYLCEPGNIRDITNKCAKALYKSWDRSKIINNVALKYSKNAMLKQYDVAFSAFVQA